MMELFKTLKKYGKVKAGKGLKKLTMFKIGGPANFVIEVTETDKLTNLLDFLTGEGIEYLILGGGSNILAPDAGFDGVVILVRTGKIKIDDGKIIAEAGAPLPGVVVAAAQNSLSGMEWAAGIPGTVGGAVRGNAGAMGEDTAGTVESVKVWRDGEIINYTAAECGFAYRSSVFKRDGGVILSAVFALREGKTAEITRKIQTNILHRLEKIPTESSAGSFFQNIKLEDWPNDRESLPPIFVERGMIPAGWLIEQCGLKGSRYGGAGISEKHGNFIVNYGDASAGDVLRLFEEAKEKVYNKFGVNLVPEVRIIY